MGTLKEQVLASKVAETFRTGADKTQGQLIQEAGYSPVSAQNPKIIFNQPGFREELAKLGFSLDAADQTVNNLLINGKEENTRLKAADMVYKRLGGYAPDRTLNISVKGDIKEFEQFAELREKYEAELLNTFTHETTLGPVDNGMADSEPNKD